MSQYTKQNVTAKNTSIPTNGLPLTLPTSLIGRTGLDSIVTGVIPVRNSTLPVTTDAADLPENVTELRRMVAKLRTEVGLKNEQLRAAYERQANDRLKATVELERVNFQKQIDAYKEYANGEIAKAYTETAHWQEQVKIIYDLLEQQTQEANRLIAGLQAEVARQPKPKPATGAGAKKRDKKVSGKLKRQLEGE